jgi:type IV pilus assembly protein PilB
MAPLQNNDRYIGQLLIKDGVITATDLEKGLQEQKRNAPSHLCTNLVRLGFASEEKIFSILSLQIGVPFVNLKEVKIDPVILNLMPARLAMTFRCLPLRRVGDVIYIAMSDPLNTKAIKEIKSYLGVSKLKIFLAGDMDVQETIKSHYGLKLFS